MPKIKYQDFNFRQKTLDIIDHVNDVVNKYQGLGYNLTLRQVYYQLVAQNIIENTERSYKSVGSIINDGRLAGLIDWYAIEDRTRMLRGYKHFDNIPQFIKAVSNSYRVDKWIGQNYYVEVWVEKDALVDIVGRACNRLDVPYFSCRGYVSQSEMWVAARRLQRKINAGMNPVIIHLGDHDPSGIDMTRDITERLNYIFGVSVKIDRHALQMEQIDEYNPPPNPAKISDSRYNDYILRYGKSSWELDALKPEVLNQIILDAVGLYLDQDTFNSRIEYEQSGDNILRALHNNYPEIEQHIRKNHMGESK